ncbi:MAG: tRNA (N(6)-L-threonylcarbamoyladenosine(37)-C(2))-methylthiotransferase MtaB [Selenomonadaceae bacterium]|nr:tRNA (N(6)-L-threonylcarbamoyladenosine(37)-C(2))-methylthiotransferase MtaB [Selenomonadaceae bacterium]
MKVAFYTLGCKVNWYETEAIGKIFQSNGYEIVTEINSADVVVVNTCAVTAISSQKSRQAIRRAIRANPNAVVCVLGCYAQNSPAEISAIDGVDVIVGTAERMKIVELVEQVLKNRDEKILRVDDVEKISAFEELPHTPQRTRAFLKIEDGCNNFCAYCIIPYLRGRVRSRSLENIRAECLELAAGGYREIVLTGIHIGAYGADFKNKISLVDAVKTVLDAANPLRLRLGSIESAEMSDELIDLIKSDERICNHVHLPLQSGSDEILKSMRRPYTTKNFAALTSKLVKEIPDISIGTDLIVGFPNETEKNFAETLDFVQAQPFSKIHVFPFSAREGTLAATMQNQIPAQVKRERAARALEISAAKEKIFAEKLIGKTVEIIAETQEENFIDGLTKNYVRVYVPASSEINSGDVVKVHVEKIFRNGVLATSYKLQATS